MKEKKREITNTNVAVMGGAGFLGSHLCRHLLSKRCNVYVFDNLSSGSRDYLPPGVTLLPLDIYAEMNRMVELFFKYEIDFVFNYAALPFIPDCLEEPIRAVEVNTLGALHVLEASRITEVEAVLMVTSAEVYGNSREHLIEPVSTYACSKAAIDLMIDSRVAESGVPAITLRQFNCVGERETHPYVVPEIISQLHRTGIDPSAPTVSLGADTARDFMYAGDAVQAATSLIEHGEFGEVYDLGSEVPYSVYNIAAMISSILYNEECKVKHDPARVRPRDVFYLRANNEKLIRTIGYNPNKTPLKEALQRTIKDYQNNGWLWE